VYRRALDKHRLLLGGKHVPLRYHALPKSASVVK
jgi:hypothetical protein